MSNAQTAPVAGVRSPTHPGKRVKFLLLALGLVFFSHEEAAADACGTGAGISTKNHYVNKKKYTIGDTRYDPGTLCFKMSYDSYFYVSFYTKDIDEKCSDVNYSKKKTNCYALKRDYADFIFDFPRFFEIDTGQIYQSKTNPPPSTESANADSCSCSCQSTPQLSACSCKCGGQPVPVLMIPQEP